MSFDQAEVLERFRRSFGHDRDQYVHNIAFHLAELILQHQDFDSVDSFVDFCADPENLRTWLPSPADRMALSAGLVTTARTMNAA